MTTPKILTQEEVLDWIEYYERGGEFEDDIMASILQMALLHAQLADELHRVKGT